jgi:hypothetical protein
MFGPLNFEACVRKNLEDRRYGKKKADELMKRLKGLQSHFEAAGHRTAHAQTMAMSRLYAEIADDTKERAKRTMATLEVHAELADRVRQGLTVTASGLLMDGKFGKTQGVALARGAVSTIESDPRFKGLSYTGRKESIRGQLLSIMDDVLEKVGKGAFGIQKGKAHLPNAVREIFGQQTGDANAAALARAYTKTQELAVDLFNQAGGSLRKLKDFHLPQTMNAVKLAGKFDEWKTDMLKWLDFGKMRYPDGSLIPAADYDKVLKEVYETLSTEGANQINPRTMRGQGSAIGNMLNQHRFLVFKDADSWLGMHEKYGEGNVFDVMLNHVEQMSHKIALVQTFGPNPELARQHLHGLVVNEAGKLGGQAKAEAEAVLKNVFDPMFETVTRHNPMDPHSAFGNLVTGTAQVLSSAMLGSASVIAIPGDFMTTLATRLMNGQSWAPPLTGYLQALLTDKKNMRHIATQSGFVMDEVVASVYSHARWTGFAHGPAVAKRLSDATMRASLLAGHTKALRWANQMEMLGMLYREKDTPFDKLAIAPVMQRYGITAVEWDAFRTSTAAWSPKNGAAFLRPIDILKTNLPNRQQLYEAFQSMVFEEGKRMVPEATIEGSAWLKGTERPDTVRGALLSSFAMFKNFPVSMMMLYGRLGMTSPSVKGRVGFYAGLAAGMTMVGALGLQLREISKGRDPLPMDTPSFIGKAILAGGGMGVLGDFLFTGVNEYGRGPEQVVGGPLIGFLGDTTDLVLGDVFAWADALGGLGDSPEGIKFPQKAVEFARRYTPGTSIWWARLALERQVWDRLQEIADPQAYKKRQRQVKSRRKDYEQEYWWTPGERSPTRAPQF